VERLKTYSYEEGLALTDFSIVRRNLNLAQTEAEIESAMKQHRNVVEKCIDLGLLAEICELRDKWQK